MKSFAHFVPAPAFAIFAAVAIASLPATGLASTADHAAQSMSQHESLSAAMDSTQNRAMPNDLQQEKASPSMVLAASEIDPRYHFYGGQY